MKLDTITMDQDEAVERLRAYRTANKIHDDPIYADIIRGLRWLARNEVTGLVDLAAVVKAGGEHDDHTPRLAVMKADERWCWLGRRTEGGAVTFWPRAQIAPNASVGVFAFPSGTLASCDRRTAQGLAAWGRWGRAELRAMVPIVPPELRPPHHLRNYAILWEVERWERVPAPPGDPALLKHVGGNLWALLGVWDLSPLERAVLSGRPDVP